MPAAQERVLHALLYALNSGGTLFLGSSETVALLTDALQVISAKHKLFTRTTDRILPMLEVRGKSTSGRARVAAPEALSSDGKLQRDRIDAYTDARGQPSFLSINKWPLFDKKGIRSASCWATG
jgi:hypothetical protein